MGQHGRNAGLRCKNRQGRLKRAPIDQRTEDMHMIRKGQVRGIPKGDVVTQVRFVQRVFGLGV